MEEDVLFESGIYQDESSLFRQDMFLTFDSEDIEDQFIEYMHPASVTALPVCYFLASLLYVNTLIGDPTDPRTLVNLSWYVTMFIINVGIRVKTKQRHRRPDGLLSLERWIVVMCVCFTSTTDLWANLQHYQDCDVFDGVAFDSREHFEEPHCRRWWSPFAVSTICAATAIQIVPFSLTLGAAVYIVCLHCLLWLLVPPPEPLFQVWLFAIFVAAGVFFVAYVRYDQEQSHRELFVKYKSLQLKSHLLSKQQRALIDFCAVLLPRSLIQRLDQFSVDAASDVTENGTVILVGIHGFGVWSTQHTPMEAAAAVVDTHVEIRDVMTKHSMDLVGRFGDTVVAVGNLIRPLDRPARIACAAVLRAVGGSERELLALPPLCGAAHIGHLSGCFVGTTSIRYDVFGAAYDVAREAVMDCPPGSALVSHPIVTAVDQLTGDGSRMTSSSSDVVHPISGVDFLALDASSPEVIEEFCDSVGDSNSAHTFGSINGNVTQFMQGALHATSAPVVHRGVSHVRPASPNADSEAPFVYGERIQDDRSSPLATSVEGSSEAYLREKLERYKEVKTVWCCFPRFANEEVENAYAAERMAALPEAASRTWFAYALYILVILILLLADMQGPNSVWGVIILTAASVLSIAMGAAPKCLSADRMREWFFPWSVLGVVLPLLVVYGCGITRPSAVGNDTRLYILLGALVRSYCFTSSRWQAVFVPLAALVGLGQYALPGGFLRISIIFTLLLVIVTVVAEREREANLRRNTRHSVELKLILAQLEAIDATRDGLLRNAVPDVVFDFVSRRQHVNGMSRTSVALQIDGAVVVVRALPSLVSESSSSLMKEGNRFLDLDAALHGMEHLAVANILGDQALLVGPVYVQRTVPEERQAACEAATIEAAEVGRTLCCRGQAAKGNQNFSVVADFDAVVHALRQTELVQYWAFGPTVTRMLTLFATADVTSLSGFLVTERFLHQITDVVGEIPGCDAVQLGPMKFRGAGVVRFTRIQPSA